MKTVLRIEKINSITKFYNLFFHSLNIEKRKQMKKFNAKNIIFNRTILNDGTLKQSNTDDIDLLKNTLTRNLDDVKKDFEWRQNRQKPCRRKKWSDYLSGGLKMNGKSNVVIGSEVLLSASIDFFEKQGWITTKKKAEFNIKQNSLYVEKVYVKQIDKIIDIIGLEKWFIEQVNWYRYENKKCFKFDNFIGASLQLDETTPHIQMWFTNKTLRKTQDLIDVKVLVCNRDKNDMSVLQENYLKFNNEIYKCFDRLDKKTDTKLVHSDLKKYYQSQIENKKRYQEELNIIIDNKTINKKVGVLWWE